MPTIEKIWCLGTLGKLFVNSHISKIKRLRAISKIEKFQRSHWQLESRYSKKKWNFYDFSKFVGTKLVKHEPMLNHMCPLPKCIVMMLKGAKIVVTIGEWLTQMGGSNRCPNSVIIDIGLFYFIVALNPWKTFRVPLDMTCI